MKKLGPIQKKILLILLGGIALGLSSSPRQYFYTFRKISNEWKKIKKNSFDKSVASLVREKLVQEKSLADGSIDLSLTKEGKKQAGFLSLLIKIDKFKKPKKWDKKWRFVIFDIPERDREFRDILRKHLYALDFIKVQQSVFVSPHPCEKIISKMVQIYKADKYVRVITALKIDNEKALRKHFFKSSFAPVNHGRGDGNILLN